MTRNLSPYEQNHLLRHHFDPHEVEKYGEMPVEYITGHVDFCGYDFLINQEALIPRLETEELVELAFQEVQKLIDNQVSTIKIADIGSGSGAIALSLLLKLLSLKQVQTRFSFYLSDVSETALQVAAQNMAHLLPDFKKNDSAITPFTAQYSWTDEKDQTHEVFILTSDLLRDFPKDVHFDLMVSNLPYIPTSRIPSLEPSVKDFEPTVALDGGSEGLSLIQTFLKQAVHFLQPHGRILLEVDYTHTAAELIAQTTEFKAEVITDQFLRQRFGIISLK